MNHQPIVPDELRSCVAKLDRARERLDEYASWILDHRKTEPYRLVREEQAGIGNYIDYVYSVQILHPPPLEASVAIGEFLYNVHSALDHLANRLAERVGNDTRVTFPIFKNRSKFWRKGKDGAYVSQSGAARLMCMPEDAWNLIEDVQPYKRGNEAPRHELWLLHELSNADKHHAMHVVGSALTDTRLIPNGHDAIPELRNTNYGPFENGDEIARLRLWITGPNPEMKFQTKFATTEALAEEGPAAGMEPGVLMRDILVYVLAEIFEKRFVPYFANS